MKDHFTFENESDEFWPGLNEQWEQERSRSFAMRGGARSQPFRSGRASGPAGAQRRRSTRPWPKPRPKPRPRPGGWGGGVWPVTSIGDEPAASAAGRVECGSENIRWAQSTLNRVMGLNLPVSGVADVQTRSAVRSFQRQRGLPDDGVIGPPTERALIDAGSTPASSDARPPTANGAPPPVNSDAPAPSEEFEQFEAFDTGLAQQEFESGDLRNSAPYIRWLQQALNQAMGLRLAVDGVAGPQTRSAIRGFQQRRGLVVDGVVGPKTEAALIAAGVKAFSGGAAPAPITPPRPGCNVIDGFDFDNDRVKTAHQATLIKIAREIIASQSTPLPIRVVDLVGHTDRVGDDAYNVGLGKRRADQTAQSLRLTLERIKPGSSRGVTLRPDSRGEAQPVSTDKTRNRRVEICLLRPPKPKPPKPKPPIKPPPPVVPSDLADIIGLVKRILTRLPGLGLTGIKVPTTARFLTAAEQSEAMKVYSGSLDFTKILISDGLGFQGRPFTVAAPLASGSHVVMNLGDLGSWETRPRSNTLIHELAHAWQSQHHGSDPAAFMKNSVLCQARALADLPIAKAEAAAAASAAAVSRGVLDPRTLASIAQKAADAEDVSPYAYIPGKTFGDYAAEQIAQQVEDAYRGGGRPTPGVLPVIRSVSANVRSRNNETSLGVTSFHRKSEAGVVFP
jgi:peptidoglycan hydrolase-like protein with peptidoglycan-binding domain